MDTIRTKDTAMIAEIFNRVERKVKDRLALGGEFLNCADSGLF